MRVVIMNTEMPTIIKREIVESKLGGRHVLLKVGADNTATACLGT